ncbi:MAG: type III-B CRISPR module-associated protein Cmr5 [Geminicoccaceae bacterium]|nr:type III-B CRISPR module-associated protein Cmr5 [Geminicoccaceae bacterium]
MSAVLRDQERARFAYERVAAVPPAERDDYENAVLGLGADILRVGLVAALAAVQRLEKRGARLLDDLAAAKIPGLEAADGKALVAKARTLDADRYMIATRETLAVVSWLRRACQAQSTDRKG